ncbi:MAG: NTP transferase domain-containing protein [Desulfobacterales bacterium]|nr:NTP transferase domain-containing protein [Desulfobacterales bacterium]
MKKHHIAAIIPAAGYSSRMGRLKATLPLNGKTVIETVISGFQTGGVSEIHVIVGHRKEKLYPFLQHENIHIVENAQYADGMYSSVIAGISSLQKQCDAFLICPVDMPLIRPWTIRHLISGFKKHPDKIIYPCFMGQKGHPPVIPTIFKKNILDHSGADGLEGALRRYHQDALCVEVPDRNIMFNINKPEDYEELLNRYIDHNIPTPEECRIILTDIFHVSGAIQRHAMVVAQVAKTIANKIIETGGSLNIRLIEASALLHDMAKGQKDHAQTGGKVLSDMGYEQVAEIVAAHTDGKPFQKTGVSETDIVFLADKWVKNDRIINMEKRFQFSLDQYGDNIEAEKNIKKRWQLTTMLKSRIEKIIDQPIETIISNQIKEV